jgi:YwiC-like protein
MSSHLSSHAHGLHLRRTVGAIASDVPHPRSFGVRLRPIALPAEHGAWAFLCEPIALGLLLAPSIGGICLALAATGVFLGRHPVRLWAGDLRRGRPLRRTSVARTFSILYFLAAGCFFAAAFFVADKRTFLPLIIALPFVAVQFACDFVARNRALFAELAGVISTGAIAAAIALAAGWRHSAAFGLWAVMAGRAVPSTFYVRERLKLVHGELACPQLVIMVHILALVAIVALASISVVPALAVVAMAILCWRAASGLIRNRDGMTAKKLGLAEIAFGVVTVLATTVGGATGW